MSPEEWFVAILGWGVCLGLAGFAWSMVATICDLGLLDRFLPKLVKPPKGTRWELRNEYRYMPDLTKMHLVDENGNSLGAFLIYGIGNELSDWRYRSKQVVKDYKRHRRQNYEHLPEIAGYTIEKKE